MLKRIAYDNIRAFRQTPDESLPACGQKDGRRSLILLRQRSDALGQTGINLETETIAGELGSPYKCLFIRQLQTGVRRPLMLFPKCSGSFAVFALHQFVLPFGELYILHNLVAAVFLVA